MQKKEGFKSGMKERVGDGKLIIIIIISITVSGINDRIRFCRGIMLTAALLRWVKAHRAGGGYSLCGERRICRDAVATRPRSSLRAAGAPTNKP